MAKTNTIITIGREYGSAGRQIGYKVAEDLGIKLLIRISFIQLYRHADQS